MRQFRELIVLVLIAVALTIAPSAVQAQDWTVYNVTSDATAVAGVVDFVGVRLYRTAAGAAGAKVYDTVISASAASSNLIWDSAIPAVPADAWSANLTSSRVLADGLVYTGAAKIAGVKIWPIASGASSVILYDATSATGTKAWELHGPISNATTPYTSVGIYSQTVSDYLPAGQFKSASTGIYADVSNCSAEVYYTTFGASLCPSYMDIMPGGLYETTTNGLYVDLTNCTADLYVSNVRGVTLTFSGTYYQGTDSETGDIVEAATPGVTVTVSETFANYLLTNFPSYWSR